MILRIRDTLNKFFLLVTFFFGKTELINKLALMRVIFLLSLLKAKFFFYRKGYSEAKKNLMKSSVCPIRISHNGKLFNIRDTGDFFTIVAERDIERAAKKIKGSVFIDVGAHIGKYSIILSDNFERVVSVEAENRNFAALKGNITLNGLDGKIMPVNKAAFSGNGKKLVLKVSKNDSVTHAVSDEALNVSNKEDFQEVESVSIDDLIADCGLNPADVDLIKIDAEGAEYPILLGAKNILNSRRVKIIIEIWEENSGNYNNVKNMLTESGFAISRISRDYYFVSPKIK